MFNFTPIVGRTVAFAAFASFTLAAVVQARSEVRLDSEFDSAVAAEEVNVRSS